MRRLNAKQKRAIEAWAWDFRRETKYLPYMMMQIDGDEYDRIFDMNPHETFESNADRFLSDLRSKRKE